MTLIIPGRLPGLNDYTKANRSNRYMGAKMKREQQDYIWLAIRRNAVPFEGRVRLDFRWYEKDRRRDIDNVCFAKKFILDTLVEHGIIQTDGWRGVEGFTDTFFVDKDNPRVEIDIEETDGFVRSVAR